MLRNRPNSRLSPANSATARSAAPKSVTPKSAECWLDCLVCPRRYRANLPSRLRPNLFGSD
jgi:hypothetical protein